MMYGIALREVSNEDLKKFDVVTVPRSKMITVVTKYSESITDGSGQSEPVPIKWANGWIVEAKHWTEEHTSIINNAVADYNSKYPNNPIPDDYKMIW